MCYSVMKFGGTSVGDIDAVRRLARIVGTRRGQAVRAGTTGPVVVVSALSKVTDALLDIARHALTRSGAESTTAIDALVDRHRGMLPLVSDPVRRDALAAAVQGDLDELRELAGAFNVLGEVSPRSHDAVAALGELASSRIVAAALEDAGLPAVWVDAREVVVTDDTFMSALPDMDATNARLHELVRPILERGGVPVMGGFIGATPAGVTTTLGRGGSDYSAAIVGAGLDVREIEIWTDVDGMLTADPRLVDGASVVEELSFEEASELAYFGAKVLHPATIQPALARNIPVRILNSRRPEGEGTRIAANPSPRQGLTAIACKRGVIRIDITSTRMLMAYGFLRRVFEVFERHRTPVDVVTTSEVSVSVTVDDNRELAPIVADLGAFADVGWEESMAIVCAVGDDLRSDPTLGARVLGSLEGLRVSMVSQGGSRRNLTCVLPDDEAVPAMRRLHERFFSARAAVR